MATGDAAYVAGKLKGDNRTVVGSKVAGAATVVMATSVGPNGAVLKNDAASPATLTAETATEAAYVAGLAADDVKGRTLVVPILPNVSGDAYDKRNLRTQYFHGFTSYDSSKAGFGAKRCYVNVKGQPIKADGTLTTPADAVDAETTALSVAVDAGTAAKIANAVTNYEQVYRTNPATRAVAPGKYLSHPFQTSLYAPYAGWTAQQG